MEWFIAVGVIVLMAVLIVGLFHGPTHEHRPHLPHRAHRSAVPAQAGAHAQASSPEPSPAAPLAVPPFATTAPVDPTGEPLAYTLPPAPPRRRLRRPAGRPGGRRT